MHDPSKYIYKIADILGLPIESFWGFSRVKDDRLDQLQDCLELLESFDKIEDHHSRRRCINYIKDQAERFSK